MARCFLCGKGRVISTIGKHRRGVAGGQWKKKAPKSRKIFKPNLHKFQGKMYCTKCLRRVKSAKGGSRDWPVVRQPADFTGRKVKKEVAQESKVPRVSQEEVQTTESSAPKST